MEAETVWPFFVINFDTASAALTIAAQQKLNEVVAGYRINKPKEVIVKGHTDRAGGKEANLVLSVDRTNAVVNFLLDAGIPNKVFKPESLGESKPLTRVKDGISHPLDRRVEIELK